MSLQGGHFAVYRGRLDSGARSSSDLQGHRRVPDEGGEGVWLTSMRSSSGEGPSDTQAKATPEHIRPQKPACCPEPTARSPARLQPNMSIAAVREYAPTKLPVKS